MRKEEWIVKGQQRRSRAEAEQLVDRFAASGMRRREFCLKYGVAVATLDFWRKRRRQERGKQKVGSRSRLVAVELADVPTGVASGGIVVVDSRGRRIEVSRDFDAATLERLLAVLDGM